MLIPVVCPFPLMIKIIFSFRFNVHLPEDNISFFVGVVPFVQPLQSSSWPFIYVLNIIPKEKIFIRVILRLIEYKCYSP